MISERMQEALNNQINEELFSSYLYLSMSSYFQETDLPGFASWMRVQAQEELMHAMKIFDFIAERGGQINLQAVKEPVHEWESPLGAFEAAYSHERHITGCIDNLVDLARENRDHATEIFLQWFVTEQVEEESSADEIVKKLKMIDGSKNGLFMMDRELGTRVFTAGSE